MAQGREIGLQQRRTDIEPDIITEEITKGDMSNKTNLMTLILQNAMQIHGIFARNIRHIARQIAAQMLCKLPRKLRAVCVANCVQNGGVF